MKKHIYYNNFLCLLFSSLPTICFAIHDFKPLPNILENKHIKKHLEQWNQEITLIFQHLVDTVEPIKKNFSSYKNVEHSHETFEKLKKIFAEQENNLKRIQDKLNDFKGLINRSLDHITQGKAFGGSRHHLSQLCLDLNKMIERYKKDTDLLPDLLDHCVKTNTFPIDEKYEDLFQE